MAAYALVVDDDQFSLEVLTSLLEMEGLEVTAIRDVAQLPATLDNNNQFKIVFLDLEMPKMNGYEAFQVIKANLPETVPVVAYTAHVNEFSNARNIGFHSFIAKPLDQDKFPTQLKQILSGQRVRG